MSLRAYIRKLFRELFKEIFYGKNHKVINFFELFQISINSFQKWMVNWTHIISKNCSITFFVITLLLSHFDPVRFNLVHSVLFYPLQ